MDHVRENTVHVIDDADVRVVPGSLEYTEQHQQIIALNWKREQAAKPTLFDGEIFLAPEARLADGVLKAGFKRSSFATLMHWRNDPEPVRPWHIFGVGVIVSGEGHLIAARMGMQNAGGDASIFRQAQSTITTLWTGAWTTSPICSARCVKKPVSIWPTLRARRSSIW